MVITMLKKSVRLLIAVAAAIFMFPLPRAFAESEYTVTLLETLSHRPSYMKVSDGKLVVARHVGFKDESKDYWDIHTFDFNTPSEDNPVPTQTADPAPTPTLTPKVRYIGNGYYSVDQSGKLAVVDSNGEEVLPALYSDVVSIDDRTFAARNTMENKIYLLTLGEEQKAVCLSGRVTVNGFAIPSYIVGDELMIAAEDLSGYGFDVDWNETERTLNISKIADYGIVTEQGCADDLVQIYSIVDSDVRVYYEGTELQAYSIGGKMLINPENLVSGGITCTHNDDGTLSISK